jgi:hypothetical protein
MTARIRVVEFQVPPTEHGWYGVICDAGTDISTVAVYWTGREWLDYPAHEHFVVPAPRREYRNRQPLLRC